MVQPLLPSGLADVLPPLAAREFRLVHHFLKCFLAFGYQPVIPPLMEYTKTLLDGQGEATSHQTFRVADPLSPQMLGLRADMTGQVARIAGAQMAAAPRPLRLCYAGYTLRTAPEALKIRRQHTQVGLERFGDSGPNAVSELLAIAVQALSGTGVMPLTIDLHYPSLLEALLKECPAAVHTAVRDAVRLKDVALLRQLNALTIAEIIEHSGPAEIALAWLERHANAEVQAVAKQVKAVMAMFTASGMEAHFTIDLLDLSGYGYYAGIGYALYWNQGAIEVGRGGRYRTQAGEDAVGFTLYINDLLDKLPPEPLAETVTLPPGTTMEEALKKQQTGVVTVFP